MWRRASAWSAKRRGAFAALSLGLLAAVICARRREWSNYGQKGIAVTLVMKQKLASYDFHRPLSMEVVLTNRTGGTIQFVSTGPEYDYTVWATKYRIWRAPLTAEGLDCERYRAGPIDGASGLNVLANGESTVSEMDLNDLLDLSSCGDFEISACRGFGYWSFLNYQRVHFANVTSPPLRIHVTNGDSGGE